MIRKARLVLGLITATSALAISVSPASAEFTSHSKSTEGSKTPFSLNIEEIGGTVNCGSLESGPTWQIKKAGKAAEVGPVLTLKFKSLSKCVLEYKEGETTKEVNATSNECEWETSETGKETAVKLAVVKTCIVKPELAKACEIKIEPEKNKALETVALFDTGEKSEGLDINIDLTKVTVATAGEGCTSAGIKSTSAAKVSGAIEVEEIQPGMAAPQFSLSSPTVPVNFTKVKQKREVFVENVSAGAAATPQRAGISTFVTGRQFGFWQSENKKVSECATTALNEKQTCKMEIQLISPTPNRIITGAVQYFEGNQQDEILVRAIT